MEPKLELDITVVITAHTPRIRSGLLTRATSSVWRQTHLPDAITVAVDHEHQGAAITRNRALEMATTDWIVFLDSDDILFPNYLQRVCEHQKATGADVVWPWFKVSKGGKDPFPMHFGKQWDPEHPHSFPITTLVRKELAVKVGGFPVKKAVSGRCLGEDFSFWKSLSSEGAKFSHLPEYLWEWNHGSKNTGGLGSRW